MNLLKTKDDRQDPFLEPGPRVPSDLKPEVPLEPEPEVPLEPNPKVPLEPEPEVPLEPNPNRVPPESLEKEH